MQLIEIYLLEQLAAFREYGTLSAAAEHLNISQPALSRSMQKLEDIFGVSLFIRSKNRIALDRNGEIAAEHAGRILRSEEEMLSIVRNHDRSRRTISLGSCAPGPLMEYPGILSRLYDGMTIATDMTGEDALLKGLRDGVYQLAILSHPVDDPDLVSRHCGSEHLYISVIPAHPAAVYRTKGVTFSEMNGETFLMNANIGVWDAVTREHMPDSRLILQSDNDALLEIINASTLPSFVTDLTLRLRAFDTDRVNVPFNDPEATMQYYCVCSKANEKRFRRWFEATGSAD